MFVDLARAVYSHNCRTMSPGKAVEKLLTETPPKRIAKYVRAFWRHSESSVKSLPGDRKEPEDTDLPPFPGKHRRHIIYAYMLESTNMLTVFQRVLEELLNGERLPFATPATQLWLRTTEQLFFTTPQPPSILSLMSDIRPDRGAIRRNAYYRLMGLDLPPGIGDGRPYVKADIANRDFVKLWEQLLYEVWRAYVNVTNSSGPNSTDIVGMEELIRELHEMLIARRVFGTLSREEKDAVTLMGWFHLTIINNNQVITNLTAESTSPALRLKKIADMVDVPIQKQSDSFIQLADAMADILEAIEANVALPPQELYANGNVTDSLTQRMLRVITHWGVTTGRDVKGITLRGAIAGQTSATQSSAGAIPLPQTSRFQAVSRT